MRIFLQKLKVRLLNQLMGNGWLFSIHFQVVEQFHSKHNDWALKHMLMT